MDSKVFSVVIFADISVKINTRPSVSHTSDVDLRSGRYSHTESYGNRLENCGVTIQRKIKVSFLTWAEWTISTKTLPNWLSRGSFSITVSRHEFVSNFARLVDAVSVGYTRSTLSCNSINRHEIISSFTTKTLVTSSSTTGNTTCGTCITG